MSDLKADTALIRACSDRLQRVYDEFTNRPNPADSYSPAELGDPKISGAFGEFSDNWKLHRQELAKKIRTLGIITQDAADSYDGIDADLAAALRTTGEGR
ncbi:MAG: hypothetical protein JO362_09580 [Streptomycetaceae bacterium]|nr:hypothetical protein [Streptomycetaceae bacterium]